MLYPLYKYASLAGFRSRVHSDGSVPSNSQSTNDARGVETGEEERQECAICIEEYASGDRVVALPCGHLLHQVPRVREWGVRVIVMCRCCTRIVELPLLVRLIA